MTLEGVPQHHIEDWKTPAQLHDLLKVAADGVAERRRCRRISRAAGVCTECA